MPLFQGSSADLMGPKSSGTSSAGDSIESALDAVELKSGRGVDYEPLREALKEQDFLKADDIHRKKLIEVAGEAAQERGWVWFSEVGEIPIEDMQTFDELWKAGSRGKFGFSVQRQVWRACNEQWSKFFLAIDWLQGENLNYRAWPAEFVYDLDTACKGHLPLTNALRGTQLFQAILQHPAFDKKDKLNSWSE